MIKKIRTDQVRVGMYVNQLDRPWMDHSFFASRFAVKDASVVARLSAEGIAHVFIDTDKGIDVEDTPAPELAPEPAAPLESAGLDASAAEERGRARAIFGEATQVVRNVMGDVRLGRQIDVVALEPLTDKMIASVFRNPHALTSVARIKSKDEYTFMHSVSVAAIMIAFARFLELPEEDIHQIARGALLHDIGKVLVPSEVLNKPGSLTEEEFVVMRGHAERGVDLLRTTVGFSDRSMEAVAMHHERNDGSGYPFGLKGDQISLIGHMSAIVDVYDALTSLRVYKAAWEPSVALKKMLEWSPAQFDPALVQRFIRCLGIYPVGSLVELESGLVGIVTEQTADLLRPHLLVVYSSKNRCYIRPRTIELDRPNADRIVGIAAPAQYGIDLGNFI